MDKRLHKRIKVVSFIIMLLASLVALGYLFLKGEKSNLAGFDVLMFWIVAIIFPLLALITSYLINHPERTMIRKVARYTLIFSPLILGLIIFGLKMCDENTIISVISAILLAVSGILVILHLFVFSDAGKVTVTVVLMLLIITGIVFKRLHLPIAGSILVISLTIFSIGYYVYGIRCLYLAEGNRFMRYFAFLTCCIIAVSLLGLEFKLQRWPLGDAFIISGRWSLVLGTMLVLLALPSSGYFEWKELHKRILKRMILPWGLLFLLFVLKLLLPEVDAIIWSKDDRRVYPGFEMFDYEMPAGNDPQKQQVKEQ